MPSVASSMSPRTLSRSVEDYLKAIYRLGAAGDPASTSSIAQALDIQPASVTGMVKRMAETGLLEHVPYRGVRLTEAGTREALRVLRRHRILETYLCARLGYTWDDVHEEAERLEHAVSDRLIDRMARALGFPSHDPHGAPIPTSAGHIETVDYSTLADAVAGDRLLIHAVRDEDPEALRSMAAEGLIPGARIVVEAAADGSIEVDVTNDGLGARAVPTDIAQDVFVVPDPS
jgi:DtxR family Mn-dependent transcriptional regulator